MSEPEPFRIPDYDNDPWTVSVSKGDPVHVTPLKGLLGMNNWAMTTHKPGSMGGGVVGIVKYFLGICYRREYPRGERQLRKAIAECEVWCANQNTYEEQQRQLVKRVTRAEDQCG